MEENAYLPHQQRVVDEKNELDEKLGKLIDFISGETITNLPKDEIIRLQKQRTIMTDYSMVLGDRITAF